MLGLKSTSWLVRIAIAASLLISVLAFLFAYRSREVAHDSRQRELSQDASGAARAAELYIREHLDSLVALANTPAFRAGDADAVQVILDAIPGVAGFSSLVEVDRDGYVVAVTGGLPPGPPTFVGDRDHIQEVLRTGRPAIGSTIQARIIEGVAVPFAVPIEDASGRAAVLAAGLYLSDQQSLRFSPDPSMKVLDRRGQVVAEGTPDFGPLEFKGDWEEYEALGSAESGLIRGTGMASGADSVIAFAKVPVADWTVVLERPAGELFANADRRFQEEAGAILAFFGSTLVVLLFLDARSRRQQAAELAALARAERAVESRDEFVSRVLHDLRTPLTVAKASAALAQRRDGEARADAMRSLDDGLRRIEAMLAEMDDARGRAFAAKRAWFDGQTMLERVIEQQRMLHSNATFVLDVTVEPGATTEVCWDEALVVRALENLLSNAVKYGGRGSPIRLGAEFGLVEVALAVEDHGRGIPEEDLERVMEPFQRGGNAGGTSGLGIGLANVSSIVRLHSGRMAIRSRPGAGTTVTLHLPRSEDEGSPLEGPVATAAGPDSAAPTS